MEFQELIGTRRSIRFFDPKRPVEQDKIQKILEACLIASCAVNAHWLRAIVVKRDDIPKAELEKLKNPVQATVIELAPVHIVAVRSESLDAAAAMAPFVRSTTPAAGPAGVTGRRMKDTQTGLRAYPPGLLPWLLTASVLFAPLLLSKSARSLGGWVRKRERATERRAVGLCAL